MKCSENPEWIKETKEKLMSLRIDPPDQNALAEIRRRWDQVAKPVDGMGRFEELIADIGAAQHQTNPAIDRRGVLIFCADNGIVEEGISQSGQEVTLAVMRNMVKQASSVGRMAGQIGCETIPIDIGVNCREAVDGVWQRKVRAGTRNFAIEPAMTEAETLQAIFTGIDCVKQCKEQGYQILATGEMGIGNTTTSSAVAAALLRCEAEAVTGRGAGLDDRRLGKKRSIVGEAVSRYRLHAAEPLEILRTVGGLDLAGLTGACIGGALCHVPVVLDGMISLTAALLAERLRPGTAAYLIPSHRGREPAAGLLLKELKMHPVLDADLALGEGTGAVMLLSLLDLAFSVYRESSTFAGIRMKPYERYETV